MDTNILKSKIKDVLPQQFKDIVNNSNSEFIFDEKTNRFTWKLNNTIFNFNNQTLIIQGGEFNINQLNTDNFNVEVQFLESMSNKTLFNFCSGNIIQTFEKTHVLSFTLHPNNICDLNSAQFNCTGFTGTKDECTTYDLNGNWLAIGY